MNKKFERSHVKNPLPLIICALLAAVTLYAASVLAASNPANKVIIAAFAAVIYIAVCFFVIKITDIVMKKTEIKRPSGPVLGSIMYDTINSSAEPALICDEVGKIVWFNKNVQSACGNSSVLGAKIGTVFTGQINDVLGDKKPTIRFADKQYLVDKTKIRSGDKFYFLLLFRDVTELVSLKKFVKDDEKIVSYIIVDNLEELLQFEQERYREAAAQIETLIREWASSCDGIVKEYERDKYLFVFKSENLDKFIEDKFDILDRVRDIRVGTGNISVTISIGVAKVSGELADKEKAAHIALDMALQRGGDQAVVKYDETVEFYGGRTNAVHKRTKVRARVVCNELITHIANAGNVLVMAHKYPDYDAFGASVGISRIARFCGVRVNIVTNPKDVNIKRCMKLFDGDESYDGIFVDAAQGLDLVRSDTLLVIVDVNNIDMFESADIANNVANIIIVDHHRKTAEFDREPLISYIEPSSSSASELVSEMIEQTLPPSTLRHNEADILLAGILLDTKQFTKGTGTKTYASAMYLRDNGASYEDVQDLFKTNIRDYKQEAMFGERVEIYRHCMAIAVNPHGEASSDRILAARVADNLLMVDEVAASFALVLIDDTVHISARSNGTVNVQLILEALKGGGRYDAAGAQLKASTLQDALLKLKQAIDNYLDPED